MNLVILQIAIIFIPGFLWASIDQRFGARIKRPQTQFLILIMIFGLVTYTVVYLIYDAFSFEFSQIEYDGKNKDSVFLSNFVDEIIASIPTSIILAVVWIYASNKKLLARTLQKIGATRRYGDEDVWDFTFNSSTPSVEYVHLRDFENGYIYGGWVSAFSESEKLREILLRDVVVYDAEEGKEVNQAPHMYLARQRESITIEFPFRANNGGQDEEG